MVLFQFLYFIARLCTNSWRGIFMYWSKYRIIWIHNFWSTIWYNWNGSVPRKRSHQRLCDFDHIKYLPNMLYWIQCTPRTRSTSWTTTRRRHHRNVIVGRLGSWFDINVICHKTRVIWHKTVCDTKKKINLYAVSSNYPYQFAYQFAPEATRCDGWYGQFDETDERYV